MFLSLLLWLATTAPRRALWVWEPGGSPQLLAFAEKEHITDLFVQWCPACDKEKLRAFLRASRKRNIRVYALDGSPEAALPQNQAAEVKEVDAIAAFNESSQPDERFAGIHFDIEPYLLPGFDGPLRDQILAEYVDLQREISAELLLHKAAELTYGIDLPFWFDTETVRKALAFVDIVGIMDYRNQAFGRDGIIAHALPILRLAEQRGRQVFVGVETSPISPRLTFAGKSRKQMEWELEAVISRLSGEQSFAGIAINDFDNYRALLRFRARVLGDQSSRSK